MRVTVGLLAPCLLGVTLLGCPEPAPPAEPACAEDQRVPVWLDADGDGFGGERLEETQCPSEVVEGQVLVGQDCDDDDEDVNPDVDELCDGVDNDCDGEVDQGLDDHRVWWFDGDGDGFGTQYPAMVACADPGDEWVANADDCDDASAEVFPGAAEVCNGGVDDDCDGVADDADDVAPSSLTTWYHDADGDGFGDRNDPVLACAPPAGWIADDQDCADNDATRNPDGLEVCNNRDDDCDGQVDDADPDIDPSTQLEFFVDNDNDGAGAAGAYLLACQGGPGRADNDLDCNDNVAALNIDDNDNDGYSTCDGDCNDASAQISPEDVDNDGFTACDPIPDCAPSDPTVNPGATETPADGIDQDCDAVDDCFRDLDQDTYGVPVVITGTTLGCQGVGEADNTDDCDDTDPLIDVAKNWYADGDGDGVGAGSPVGFACLPPVPSASSRGDDCDDGDIDVFPGAVEVCNNGLDENCDLADTCSSCNDWFLSDPLAPSGSFSVTPDPTGPAFDVYCDMDTDGGGWTLVASTFNTTLNDEAASYYADLATLEPAGGHSGIWGGLRGVTGQRSDIRFTCKTNVMDTSFAVDLSFYDTWWYTEITTGTDTDSCFNESNGAGYDPPPRRRNNVNGQVLAAGNDWNAGYLEGEDSCSDSSDFTIDFDDRGMDSNQSDGTDWGEDDSTGKCGTSPGGDSWFIFVREL